MLWTARIYLLYNRAFRGNGKCDFSPFSKWFGERLAFADHLREAKSPFQQVCGIYTQKILFVPMFLHVFLLLHCFLGNGGKPLEGKVFLSVRLFSPTSTSVQKSERALTGVSANPEPPKSPLCFLQGVRMFLPGRYRQSSNTVTCSALFPWLGVWLEMKGGVCRSELQPSQIPKEFLCRVSFQILSSQDRWGWVT